MAYKLNPLHTSGLYKEKGMWEDISFLTPVKISTSTFSVTSKYLNEGDGIRYKLNYSNRADSTAYALTDIVKSEVGYFKCSTAGTSAASAPTEFTTAPDINSTVTDGTVEWIYLGEWLYGIITDTSNLSAVQLSGAPLGEAINKIEKINAADLEIVNIELTNSTWEVGTNRQDIEGNPNVLSSKGYLVYVSARAFMVDTGATKASIQIVNNSTHFFITSDGIEFTTDDTFNHSGISINEEAMYFPFQTEMQLDVLQPGSNMDTRGGSLLLYFVPFK